MIPIVSDSRFYRESTLSEALAAHLIEHQEILDALRGKDRLLVLSDWGATHKIKDSLNSPGGLTRTEAVFICGLDDALRWANGDRLKWRSKLGCPEASISWKRIRGTPRELLRLHKFLKAIETLPGLLVTLTLPKQPAFVFTSEGDTREHPDLVEFRHWKPETFESLWRFGTLLNVALFPVLQEGQELIWLSDHDDMLANEDLKFQSAMHVASHVSAIQGRETVPVLITPDKIKDRLVAADLLAIPDIAAGGIGEALEQWRIEYGTDQSKWLNEPHLLRSKASEVAVWSAMPSNKITCVPLSLDYENEMAFVHFIKPSEREKPLTVDDFRF